MGGSFNLIEHIICNYLINIKCFARAQYLVVVVEQALVPRKIESSGWGWGTIARSQLRTDIFDTGPQCREVGRERAMIRAWCSPRNSPLTCLLASDDPCR